ncbi:hypothetical protein BDY24DRAFT_391676 [Mrakia frigida]|uniref:pentatricopeptide repeat-containing protein n=1 Tax=Mrakia frigida TaxID=29902 RepID=UPI003FCBEEF4
MSVWPPPASYKKKGVYGLPGRKAAASFSPPTRAAGEGRGEGAGPTGRKDKDGWTSAHAPGEEPWNPREAGFKKVRFFKGGVSGGVPKWVQRKKDAIDEERYDTSTPNPRHGGASGSSSYSSSRPLDGGVGKDYKKPRSAGGRHERRSKTATTSEHYESPRSLSIHLMAATKEGHMTLDDAYERVLAAPGVVGDNSGVWNTLMSIALRNERWTKAVGFYNEMKRRNIKPSDRTFSILLSHLPATYPATQQSLTIAASLYTTITTLSNANPHEYPATGYPLNAYLAFLARVRRYDIMERVWEDLPPRGPLSPDTLAWTAMFNGLVKREDVPEAIEDGKILWKGLVDSVMGRTGLKIDTRLLAMVMRLFLKGEKREDKELALRIATSYFVLPESVSVPLLKWLNESSASKPTSSQVVVPAVKEDQKFPPEEHSLETFFNLILTLDRPNEAVKLYKHFSDPKQPNAVRSMLTTTHLNRALAACVALPSADMAWTFLRQKSAPNAFPNLNSYHIAMEACATSVDWERAVEIFKFTTGVKESAIMPAKIVPNTNFAALAAPPSEFGLEDASSSLSPLPTSTTDLPTTSTEEATSSDSTSLTTSPSEPKPRAKSLAPTAPPKAKIVSISPRKQLFPPDARLLSAFFVTALDSQPKTPCVREALRLATAFYSLTSFELLDPHPADYQTSKPPTLKITGSSDPRNFEDIPLKSLGYTKPQVVTRATANRQFYQRKLVQTFGRCLDVGMQADTWGNTQSRDWAYLKEQLRKKVEGSHLEIRGGASPGGGGFDVKDVERGRTKESEALGTRRLGQPVEVMEPGGTVWRSLNTGKDGLLWKE